MKHDPKWIQANNLVIKSPARYPKLLRPPYKILKQFLRGGFTFWVVFSCDNNPRNVIIGYW